MGVNAAGDIVGHVPGPVGQDATDSSVDGETFASIDLSRRRCVHSGARYQRLRRSGRRVPPAGRARRQPARLSILDRDRASSPRSTFPVTSAPGCGAAAAGRHDRRLLSTMRTRCEAMHGMTSRRNDVSAHRSCDDDARGRRPRRQDDRRLSSRDDHGARAGTCWRGATFTPFDVPGGMLTSAQDINGLGAIVGFYAIRPASSTASSVTACSHGRWMSPARMIRVRWGSMPPERRRLVRRRRRHDARLRCNPEVVAIRT